MNKNITFRRELDGIKEYVPGKPIEEVKRELGIEEIIKLASNENPLGPSPKAIEAIVKEASGIHIYPDPAVGDLKAILAKEYDVRPSQFVFANGGEELIKLIAETFINEGDEILMAETTFGLYESTAKLMGGVAVKIPMKDDMGHDIDGFIDKISEKTKIIYICNPNNPTGAIVEKEELENFVSKVPENILIVIDEAYFEYAKRRNCKYPDGLEILSKRANTFVLRTFSKVAGLAGIRIGFGITSEEIVNQMSKIKGVFHVNKLAQAAAVEAVKDEDHIKNTVELNYEMIRVMEEYFDKKGFEYIPSHTNFIFVNAKKNSREVFNELLRKGIIIRPGYLWDKEDWIRISTGSQSDIARFIKEIDLIV